MKKALLLTDCSVDTALSLQRWLETQPVPVQLTILHSFTIPGQLNQPLKAATFNAAKQVAQDRLIRWQQFLSWPGQQRTELLLGEPKLVVTLHLLLRGYDYLLLDPAQAEVLAAFRSCQFSVNTQLHWLGLPAPSFCTMDEVEKHQSATLMY